MSAIEATRFLRPYLSQRFRPSSIPAYARFFTVAARWSAKDAPHPDSDLGKRITRLEAYAPLDQCYPRVPQSVVPTYSTQRLQQKLDAMTELGHPTPKTYTVAGRVTAVRSSGSKLVFMDFETQEKTVQVVCNLSGLSPKSNLQEDFKRFSKIARKGDWFMAVGKPYKSDSGQLCIRATKVPTMLSPSLHQIPTTLTDSAVQAEKPHVDMLVNKQKIQTLRLRSLIEHRLAAWHFETGYTQVSTPLLAAGVGGAVARPFETEATELAGTGLHLRIAPELWLKRLVVGGLHRVFEIGPAFRNEGVDAIHNPEFTICESYSAFLDLPKLMRNTQQLLRSLEKEVRKPRFHEHFDALTESVIDFSSTGTEKSFFSARDLPQLPFIPTLEDKMGRKLPDLKSETAADELLVVFSDLAINLPSHPNLPRLLDALAAHYLEPLCVDPTFITHHPEVMSPLAKSYKCPETGQIISARAELFIRGLEYANMYEEENSPFIQRQKFEEQLKHRAIDGEGDGRTEVDESYLEVLECGLPPTGGFGMGVDRLVMLFSGQKRIGDVLPFGTLRNVVGLATKQKTAAVRVEKKKGRNPADILDAGSDIRTKLPEVSEAVQE